MFRLSSILYCATVLWSGGAFCATPAPDAPKLTGFTATSEGGVEGTQMIQYDDKGRIIGGNAPITDSIYKAPLGVPPTVPTSNNIRTGDNGAAANVEVSEKPGTKLVDASVDFNSGLKKAAQTSNLMEKKFDAKQADLNKNTVYSRENVLTFDTWHGKYDTLGRKKADIEVEDNFDRKEARDKTMFEVKAVELPEVDWSGRRADIKGLDERLTTEKNSRYDVTPQPASERLAPKSINQLSMQDLNRYQFRRNRSDEPGLPYVKPGSEEVKIQGGAAQ